MLEILTPKQAFEKLYGETLTEREVFDIEQNLLGFFQLLKIIDDRIKEQDNDQNNGGSNNTNQA